MLEEVCLVLLQEPLSWVRGTVVHLNRWWQEQVQGANSSSYPSLSASTHRLLMGFSSHVTSEPEPGLPGRGRGRGSHSTCTLVHLYTHRPLRAWRAYTYMQTTLHDNLGGQYMHNSSPIYLYQMHMTRCMVI